MYLPSNSNLSLKIMKIHICIHNYNISEHDYGYERKVKEEEKNKNDREKRFYNIFWLRSFTGSELIARYTKTRQQIIARDKFDDFTRRLPIQFIRVDAQRQVHFYLIAIVTQEVDAVITKSRDRVSVSLLYCE